MMMMMTETRERERKRQKMGRKSASDLPWEVLCVVAGKLEPYDRLAFGLTCKTFLEAVKAANPLECTLKKKVITQTDLRKDRMSELRPSFTLGWYKWMWSSFDRREGSRCWQRVEEHFNRTYLNHWYEYDLLYVASFQGNLNAVKWLVSQGIPLSARNASRASLSGAAGGGHIAVLEWLKGEKDLAWNWRTCCEAARGGHLDVLKWLRSQDPPAPLCSEACLEAAAGGHLDILKWLRGQGSPCPWDEWTCFHAAKGGHLHILKWLRSQDPPCPWDGFTCAEAAGGGHLEILQWLRSRSPPCRWDPEICLRKARIGRHLAVIRWIEERSSHRPAPTPRRRPRQDLGGHGLAMDHWLRTRRPNRRPWNNDTEAVRSWNPPQPWGERTCALAARRGLLHALQWIRSQDPPCPWNPEYCRRVAALNRHWEMVAWIEQNQ